MKRSCKQIYEDEDGKTGREIAIRLRFLKMSKVKDAGLFIGSDQRGVAVSVSVSTL
jgi:hypothetical protein